MTDLLDTPVEALPLPVRVRNVLLDFTDCKRLRDVVAMNEAQLLRLPNFGRKSLNELRYYLRVRGLRLANAPPLGVVETVQSVGAHMRVARARYYEGAAQLRALLDSGAIDLPNLIDLLDQSTEGEA